MNTDNPNIRSAESWAEHYDRLRTKYEELEKKLRWYESGHIHTCHSECQRPLCIFGRRIDALEGRLKDINSWLKRMSELKWDDPEYAPNFKQSVQKNEEVLNEDWNPHKES